MEVPYRTDGKQVLSRNGSVLTTAESEEMARLMTRKMNEAYAAIMEHAFSSDGFEPFSLFRGDE